MHSSLRDRKRVVISYRSRFPIFKGSGKIFSSMIAANNQKRFYPQRQIATTSSREYAMHAKYSTVQYCTSSPSSKPRGWLLFFLLCYHWYFLSLRYLLSLHFLSLSLDYTLLSNHLRNKKDHVVVWINGGIIHSTLWSYFVDDRRWLDNNRILVVTLNPTPCWVQP